MTLFPRPDTRAVRIDELKLLFAIIKQRKVSPVKFMMEQWLEIPTLSGDIECTSLVTRIATHLGLWQNTLVKHISGGREYYSYEYFRQAQVLVKRRDIITMKINGREIPLPSPGLGLYTTDSFLVDV